jgi:uncharacterized membrane protein
MAEVWARVRDGYWLIPGACLVAAGVLALAMVRLDTSLQQRGSVLAFTGGPESARSLLSTISTSMLTLTALVFSITMVVLQLASSQFSPRALPTFLRDRQNQLTLGVFLATYIYALLALRQIRGTDGSEDQFVPGLTIGVAFVLVVVSLVFFVASIHHVATSIQVTTIVQRIAREGHRAIDRLRDEAPDDDAPDRHAPDPVAPYASPARPIGAGRAGTLARVEVPRLVRRASQQGLVVEVLLRPGDFVAAGQPLLVLHGAGQDDDVDEGWWRAGVRLVDDRAEQGDASTGLRQLVDIAERALSPGTNDPSTAVQCIDRLHDLLRALATCPDPRTVHADDEGHLRLVTPQRQWADHVALVLDELRLWGAGSLQVRTRLERLVEDLLLVVPPERCRPLLDRRPLFREPLELG